MKFHPYGASGRILQKQLTTQDLRTLAWFNRIVKNYIKMQTINAKRYEEIH